MTPPHGTISRYKNQRCRCPECREAHRIAQANYRERTRTFRDPVTGVLRPGASNQVRDGRRRVP